MRFGRILIRLRQFLFYMWMNTDAAFPPNARLVPRPPVLRVRCCRIVGLLLCILHYPTGWCVCVCALSLWQRSTLGVCSSIAMNQISGVLVGFILTEEHFQQYGHFYRTNSARTETWVVGWGVCPFSFYCLHFLPSMFGNSLISSLTSSLNLFNDTLEFCEWNCICGFASFEFFFFNSSVLFYTQSPNKYTETY